MKPEPDWARAVALVRRERGVRGGRGALAFAVVLAAALHAAAGTASPGAASDVPGARTREVDVMKFSKWAAAGAVVMASAAAFAGGKVPPGWMEVADSQAQFSSVQGQDGWRYLFDQGDGSAIQPMPYFVNANVLGETQQLWCTAPAFANSGSFCGLGRLHAGTNTPSSCSAPQGGFRRSVRQWMPVTPIPARVELLGEAIPCASQYSGLIALRVNGAYAFSMVFSGSINQPIDCVVDSASLQSLQLIMDPLDGSCHCDNARMHIRVLTADCNGNLVPAAVEIANGSVSDQDADGVPDSCQCTADVIQNGFIDGADLAAVLTVWGTSGGIYPRADTNGDGVVNGSDLAAVLGGWGACP